MTTTPPDAVRGITAAAGHQDEDADSSFRFRITPHRSMSERGFAISILTILTVSVLAQLYFLALGIWVAGFVALFDGLFLSAAFLACRSDRRRVETVTLRNGILHAERRRGNGEIISKSDIPAFGLELVRTNDPDYGLQRLECRHRSQTIEIGCELSPSERRSLADALAHSLSVHGFPPRLSERSLPSATQPVTQD